MPWKKDKKQGGGKAKRFFENGGFWIMGHDARPLPKGTNRFCCEHIDKSGPYGELVKNIASCKKSVLEMQRYWIELRG